MERLSRLTVLFIILTNLIQYTVQLQHVYLVGKKGIQLIDVAELSLVLQLLTSRGTVPKYRAIHSSKPETCLTKGCVKIASFITENLDESIDPCHDFYDFACGGYINNIIIREEKSYESIFSDIEDHLDVQVRQILEKESSSNDSRTTKMAKDFYMSCMNYSQINELGVQPLLDILEAFGGWAVVEADSWNETRFSLMETLNLLSQLGFSTDILFSFSVETDDKNASKKIIELDQGELGIDSEYLRRELSDPVVDAYRLYSISMAEFLGASPESAETEMLDMLQFEMQIANISTGKEERRNYTDQYNILSVKELQEMVPQISWLDFMNNRLPMQIKIKMDEKIQVRDMNYFTNLNDLLSTVSKRTLANYMIWRMIKKAASYLSDDISSLDFDLEKAMSGEEETTPNWQQCVDFVNENLPYAVGNLYVKSYFKEETKVAAASILQYLRDTFDNILKSVDWMDEATKAKALEKSKAIWPSIAYPKELLNEGKLEEYYKTLAVDKFSLLENILRINIFDNNQYFGQLRDKVNLKDWKLYGAVADVNAYYDDNENSILIPAGILQGILFDTDNPQYANFAGIGWIIGHELTHAFDDTGNQFDSKGNLKNWWEPATEQQYLRKAHCIIDQYSNYTLSEIGLHINGVISQGENIADNGGTKQSYMAYQKWVKDNGPELGLPGLKYTTNQLFWIIHAQQECGKFRNNYLKKQILTDDHSPSKYRVIGPYSNSQEFANDFNCAVGSLMNPAQKCTIW